jgi:hypothetical protein
MIDQCRRQPIVLPGDILRISLREQDASSSRDQFARDPFVESRLALVMFPFFLFCFGRRR